MKKFLFTLLIICSFANVAYTADEEGEMYYKRQIQNQRYLYNNSGLVNAINRGDSEVVEYFMQAGFDPNEKFCKVPLLVYAMKSNNYKTMESLLNHKANVNNDCMGLPIIFQAINYKNSEAVKLLIQYGVDVNAKYKKDTPINYAIRKKQTKIVELLLKTGATPNETTINLVSKSKDEYLKYLLQTNLNE